MTHWQDLHLEERIREVLAAVHLNSPDGHHFGRPYLTAYQIAIELQHGRDIPLVETLGVPLGGRGGGSPNSVSQYLGRELSQRIRREEITDIEGGFLSNEHLVSLVCEHDIRASFTDNQWDLSMFRLR